MISEDRHVIHVTYFHVCGKIPDRSMFREERGFFWLVASEGIVYHGEEGTAQCLWKCEMPPIKWEVEHLGVNHSWICHPRLSPSDPHHKGSYSLPK